ncbi:hypothetical protein [Nitrosomonas aestuarii]|uniref:hypothetical protein n=1 Tax=Nitrosomonas aestuarii TaxID=52441 RepID=UPI000D2FF7B4|nr:hypothetical protein [Nitrosomonas aestuarii]PTN13181.1 hypothetical protein C8R11_101165 [Nitrosomonas aestuarii]
MKYLKTQVVIILFILFPSLASAALISLVLERDTPSGSGLDLFVQSYGSLPDLLTNTNGSGSLSAIPLNPGFSVGGAFYDGTYNLLLERDTASAGGLDLFVQTYASLSDLLTNTNGSGSLSAIPLNPVFSVGGVFYDGAYNLLLERDTASAGGLDLFVQTYASLSDLLTNTNGSGSLSAIPLNPGFSVGGAFYDGAYHLLLERDTASAGGLDLFVQTYATLSDLLTNTNGSGSLSTIPLNPGFSVGGAFFTPDPPVVVSSPSSGMLILAGVGLLIGFRRRKAMLVH